MIKYILSTSIAVILGATLERQLSPLEFFKESIKYQPEEVSYSFETPFIIPIFREGNIKKVIAVDISLSLTAHIPSENQISEIQHNILRFLTSKTASMIIDHNPHTATFDEFITSNLKNIAQNIIGSSLKKVTISSITFSNN